MFSTSMRKCSAVVCRPGPTRLPAELLSSVLPSVLLLMVTLFFSYAFYALRDEPVLCMTPLSTHTCAPLGSRSARGHDYLSRFSDAQGDGRSSGRSRIDDSGRMVS